MKTKILNIFFGIVFVVGIGVFSYPFVSNMIQQYKHEQVINDYRQTISHVDKTTYQQAMNDAKAYNDIISKQQTISQATYVKKNAPISYEDLLDVGGVDVMGILEVPSVNIKLPIYHGTDEAKLQVGVGHYEGSSLPIGGKSTHSVLTGHRGLPSSRLLTDIDQLENGDIFYVTVLHQTIAYEVDSIKTVLPNELNDIQIVEGEDYCTLVTCTPYGINTHRLLVRGHRIAYTKLSDTFKDDVQVLSLPFVIAFVVILYAIIMFIRRKKRSIS